LKAEHRDVKVDDACELDEHEFPGESHVLVKMGVKMKEKEERLIVVGDNLAQLDEALINDLKGFTNTKFLLALSSNDTPRWQVLPQSSPLQQFFQLNFQYRNTEKILDFMHFQWDFVLTAHKTTDNLHHQRPPSFALKADQDEILQSLPTPLPSSPHPVLWLPVLPREDIAGETLKVLKCTLKGGDQPMQVVVLYSSPNIDHRMHLKSEAKNICNAGQTELDTFTWKSYPAHEYRGCEAPVVILLGDNLEMDYISRARKQLVIVTTGERMELTEDFYYKYQQRRFFCGVNEFKTYADQREKLQLAADLGNVLKMGKSRYKIWNSYKPLEFPFHRSQTTVYSNDCAHCIYS